MLNLSIIIPTYNRSDMVLQCIAKLEQQTIPRDTYEILIIDDCSTDDTPAKLAAHPSVRYFRQAKNGGPSAARNTGIRHAQGTWLLFLDDDILVAPNTLELHPYDYRYRTCLSRFHWTHESALCRKHILLKQNR